jgi:hypothetical protein
MVTGRDIEVRNGGRISSNTYGQGNAGTVSVTATDRLLVSGDDAQNADGTQRFTDISSTAGLENFAQGASGHAGTVNIRADTIHLEKGGAITTESINLGRGGVIEITVENILELDSSTISAQTASADGGDLRFSVGRLAHLSDSTLTTSVAGGTGTGGNIFGSTRFLVLDRSDIVADAHPGTSGNITIIADQVVRSPDSIIQASTDLKIAGDPNTDVGGTLTTLPGAFLDATALLPTACAARLGANLSSLRAGVTGLPADPSGLLVGSYTADRSTELTTLPAGNTVSQPEAVAARPTGPARLSFACGG